MSAVQQKQVKDALVESEERYRHVVEDQSEFIMRFVPDGTLLFVNEAYCNYFHADRNEITGKNIFEIIPPKHRDDFRRHLAGLSPEHPVSTADSRYVTDDGSVRWQRWNNRALFDEQGQVTEFQSVGRDISQQKIAENALLQAHKNLGIMNSITRHDILNQLTIVLGFLELSRESGEDPTVKEYIHKAILAAETIRAQITFTRDYQDIGSSAPQWQNLEHVVRKAIKGLDMTGISLDCQLGGIWLFVDPLIEKVFYNLADNSLRHGGHVKHIRIFSEEDENGLNILYEDDGIGIPGDAKEKVFRREYFHNTGLGLYLIREICAITNISIRETGTEGKGVRFEISVPGGKFETRPLPDSS
jgi:PAS domain S-box-containing protein